MSWLVDHWAHLCEVAGVALEVTGVLLMANTYTRVLPRQVPYVLVSALWRGRTAREAASIVHLVQEKVTASLQGLACMCLGFMLKALPSVVQIFH
jgi:hypothetical protein